MPADRRALPDGMTPRLLSREAAATYCDISPNHFDEHVAPAVPPLKFGKSKRWDVKALNRWLDERSGLAHATRPVEEWAGMLGDDRADQGH